MFVYHYCCQMVDCPSTYNSDFDGKMSWLSLLSRAFLRHHWIISIRNIVQWHLIELMDTDRDQHTPKTPDNENQYCTHNRISWIVCFRLDMRATRSLRPPKMGHSGDLLTFYQLAAIDDDARPEPCIQLCAFKFIIIVVVVDPNPNPVRWKVPAWSRW